MHTEPAADEHRDHNNHSQNRVDDAASEFIAEFPSNKRARHIAYRRKYQEVSGLYLGESEPLCQKQRHEREHKHNSHFGDHAGNGKVIYLRRQSFVLIKNIHDLTIQQCSFNCQVFHIGFTFPYRV